MFKNKRNLLRRVLLGVTALAVLMTSAAASGSREEETHTIHTLMIEMFSHDPQPATKTTPAVPGWTYTYPEAGKDSVTVDGYTFTVEKNYYDPALQNGVLRVRVENPKGVAVRTVRNGACMLAEDVDFTINRYGETLFQEQGIDFYDAEQSTKTCAYIYRIYNNMEPMTTENREGKTATDTITVKFFKRDQNRKPVYSDQTVTVPLTKDTASKRVTNEKGDWLFSLSPIGLHYNGALVNHKNAVVNFADGSKLVVWRVTFVLENGTKGGLRMERNTIYTNSSTDFFDRVIDLDQVVSVTFGDTTYPIK